jgi:hypothetical protein
MTFGFHRVWRHPSLGHPLLPDQLKLLASLRISSSMTIRSAFVTRLAMCLNGLPACTLSIQTAVETSAKYAMKQLMSRVYCVAVHVSGQSRLFAKVVPESFTIKWMALDVWLKVGIILVRLGPILGSSHIFWQICWRNLTFAVKISIMVFFSHYMHHEIRR